MKREINTRLRRARHIRRKIIGLQADRLCKQTGTPDALIAERLILTVAAKAKRLGL